MVPTDAELLATNAKIKDKKAAALKLPAADPNTPHVHQLVMEMIDLYNQDLLLAGKISPEKKPVIKSARGRLAVELSLPIKRSSAEPDRIHLYERPQTTVPTLPAATLKAASPGSKGSPNSTVPPLGETVKVIAPTDDKKPTSTTPAASASPLRPSPDHTTTPADPTDEGPTARIHSALPKGPTSPSHLPPTLEPNVPGSLTSSTRPMLPLSPGKAPSTRTVNLIIQSLSTAEKNLTASIDKVIPNLEAVTKALDENTAVDKTVAAELQKKMDDVTGKLDSTETALATTTSTINGLDFKIADVKDCKSACDTATKKLGELADTIGDIQTLREVLTKLVGVPSRVDEAVSGIGGVLKAVESLASRVTNIEQRLPPAEADRPATQVSIDGQAQQLMAYNISRNAKLFSRLLDREDPVASSEEEAREQKDRKAWIYRIHHILNDLEEEERVLESEARFWNIDHLDEQEGSKTGQIAIIGEQEKVGESGMRMDQKEQDGGEVMEVTHEGREGELKGGDPGASGAEVAREEKDNVDGSKGGGDGSESENDMAISTGEGEEQDDVQNLQPPAHHTRQASKRARSQESNPGPVGTRRRMSNANKGGAKPPSKAKRAKPTSKA